MKKQSGAIETHNLMQERYPMPGTDLGYVNQVPEGFVPDVDLSCRHNDDDTCICGHKGRHWEFEEGHQGHMGQHTFAVEKKAKKWEI